MKIRRNQTAVYWALTGVNGYGESIFAEPVEVSVRWEDKQERFVSRDGSEHTSSSVVYPASELVLGGYLYLGTLALLSSADEGDPRSVASAKEIRSINASQNLSGTFTFRKVLL